MFRIQPGESGPDSPDVDGGLATVPPDDRRIQQPSQLQARHTPCAVRLAPTFRAAASLLHNVATMSAQASARGRSCFNDAFVWVSSPFILCSPDYLRGWMAMGNIPMNPLSPARAHTCCSGTARMHFALVKGGSTGREQIFRPSTVRIPKRVCRKFAKKSASFRACNSPDL